MNAAEIQEHFARMQQNLMETLIEKVKEVIDAVIDAVIEGLKAGFPKDEQALIETLKTIKQQHVKAGFLARVQQDLVEKIYNIVNEAVDTIIDKIKELAGGMTPKEEQVMIEAALKHVNTELVVQMQQGLAKKIYDKVKKVIDTLTSKTKELHLSDEQIMIEASLNRDENAERQQGENSVPQDHGNYQDKLAQDSGVHFPHLPRPYRGNQYHP